MILSIIFMGALFVLDVLPLKYFVIISIVFVLLALIMLWASVWPENPLDRKSDFDSDVSGADSRKRLCD